MLDVEYSSQFKQDYKRCKKKHLPIVELHRVIELVAENSEESLGELRRHHNMHTLQGKWRGRCECHVANAGNWLVIWSTNDTVAFFERTGTHDELFR
ncbi:type II toxin-antitoxin system RelE/ParE family toxin [Xiamenia xianingshaonis]|uniref:Type II toxin-antitoxin system mRNA interferase toxin, RelE/StbE family n=1 Tax=Xiamenia xianingshaonis TaxID=2682776 RepID=A0ABX0IFS1_9ACTN|nr:type II toxin-antitoxin system YafQ family toxin [Xiamenia xianingshaonis]NHM13624.1 type II toxin-antitoxin system mRNA interferase toxin, RelE/StbE family [Xiamenia xianingshaonis]